jgi:hypothetical protein
MWCDRKGIQMKTGQLHKEQRRILGSDSSHYEEFFLLGYNAMWSVESQQMFWRNMSPPSSGLKT